MNIYVDFDDCLCETAEYFSASVRKMFGVDVPYEKIKYFDLQKSFKLTDEQYKAWKFCTGYQYLPWEKQPVVKLRD